MKGSKSLAETLTRLMEERGITARALSERAQIPGSTLSGWKQGAHVRDLSALRRVAHLLGCTFEYLVFGEEDNRDLGRLLTGAPVEVMVEGIYRIKLERITMDRLSNDDR